MVATTSHFDLHAHSTVSDGKLTPDALVRLARDAGVRTLALTDHDSTAGIRQATDEAAQLGLRLIPGVEVSVTWQGKTLHILGLNIDPENGTLNDGLLAIRHTRAERAARIAAKLEQNGCTGAFDGASALASGMLTRTHFAHWLIESGHATSMQDAFNKYLGNGKPGYASTCWAELEDAIDWIRTAGGQAVLAHPLRYRLTGAWLRRVLTAFEAAGGAGIEVVCGSHSDDETRQCAEYARRFNLAGSVGSDFHDPAFPWIKLGKLAALPADITPVWSDWRS